MTQRIALLNALTARGYTVAANQPSRRFTKLVKEGETPLWLGSAGALRKGPNSTGNFPVSIKFKVELLTEGKE